MHSRLFTAAVTAVVAAALAGSASGATSAGKPPSTAELAYVEEVAFEQPMSTARQPLGPKVLVARLQYAPGSATARAAAARPRRVVRAPTRALQASGCKSVWAARIGKSILGFTIWRYTQEKYFCWTSPRLTNVQVNAYPCCTDPSWHWVGNVGSAGWFLTWSRDPRGGHYSFRQGRFEQILLGRRLDSAQPWVKIWVYGNGSWSYATGS